MLLVLAVVVLASLSIVIQTLRVGISPMPTSRTVLPLMLELVSAETEGDIHELGAGWGTVALPLAARCPHAQIIAWESSPIPFCVLWLRARWSREKNLHVHFGDFFTCSLSNTRVVVCYLWTGAMKRLEEKFKTELKPGALIVTNTFALHGRTAEKTLVASDLYRTKVFRYVA